MTATTAHRFGLQTPPLLAAGAPEPVALRASGTAQVEGGDASPETRMAITRALRDALTQVLLPALRRGELAFPTLAASLPHLQPTIVEEANRALAPRGLRLAAVEMALHVPEDAVAPAAAAVEAAPSPLASGLSNFAGNVADEARSQVPRSVGVRVGGFRIGTDGVDASGVVDGAKKWLEWKVLGCLAVAFVIFIVLVGWAILTS